MPEILHHQHIHPAERAEKGLLERQRQAVGEPSYVEVSGGPYVQPFDWTDKGLVIRKCIGEMAGTLALTWFAVLATAAPFSPYIRSLILGGTVAASIYAFGPISGSHINPIISLAFCLRGSFPWAAFPLYFVSQFVGALIGCFAAAAVIGWNAATYAVSYPVADFGTSFLYELLAGFWLSATVLLVASRHSLIGAQAALPVGIMVAMLSAIGINLSGGVFNPGVALGKNMAFWNFNASWIYLFAPFLGSALAWGVVTILRGNWKEPEEFEAAQGERLPAGQYR